MGKSHSSVVCKTLLIFAAVAISANLLCFTADGEVAADPAAAPAPPLLDDFCYNNTAVPDCDSCCERTGHTGGYVKGDVCICNSG